MKSLRNTLVAISLASAAFATQAGDLAEVKIVNTSGEHTVAVDLDVLKVGESRQFATAAGVPAIVSRDEDGLRIEIAGKTTEVALAGHGDLHWVHAGKSGDAVRVMKFDHDDIKEIDIDGSDGDGKHKVIIMRRHGSEGGDLDGAALAELLAEAEAKAGAAGSAADGEQVSVTRRITRETDSD